VLYLIGRLALSQLPAVFDGYGEGERHDRRAYARGCRSYRYDDEDDDDRWRPRPAGRRRRARRDWDDGDDDD
jgi:hypothetical protein